MVIALLITVVFVFFVWLVFFQFKWLQWSIAWAVVSAFFGLHVLLIFLIGVRFVAPYSVQAKVVQHTIQLVPRLPSFSFSLDGGRLGDGLLSLLKLNPWLLHGTLGLDLPIYEGGARIAQIRIASAEQQQAVARYGNTVLSAFGEVEAGLTDETLLAEQLRFQQRSLSDRAESVRIANIQYEAGRTDLLSVLQRQTDEIATEQQTIELHNAQLANRIDLLLAVGASFDTASAVTAPAP